MRIRKSSNILHRRTTDKLQKRCWQMKRLPSYLLALLLVCGCANTSTTPHGFERADYLKEEDAICVYVKYNQQVGGYYVSAICMVDTIYNGEFYSWHNPTAINGHGFIHFKNEEHEFVVKNPLFSDGNLSHNKNGMLIETDYIPFKPANDT